MPLKIKWKIQEAPTGLYRSFQHRGWPTGEVNAKPFVQLLCETDYSARVAKTGEHAEIAVLLADWSFKDKAKHGAFVWRRLKTRAKTLVEAKSLAQAALDAHPEFLPVD